MPVISGDDLLTLDWHEGTDVDSKGILALLAMFFAAAAFAGEHDAFYQTHFDSQFVLSRWSITAGTWQIVNGEFNASSTRAISLATVHTYDPDIPPHEVIGLQTLDVYLLIGSSAANARAGAVFDFADAGNFHEVTLNAGEFATLPFPVGRIDAGANGINERAEIVGWSTAGGFELRGTLWQEGRATDLNDLIACGARPANIVLGIATDINERGQIAVNATDSTASSGSQQRAYLLTPVSARDPCN